MIARPAGGRPRAQAPVAGNGAGQPQVEHVVGGRRRAAGGGQRGGVQLCAAQVAGDPGKRLVGAGGARREEEIVTGSRVGFDAQQRDLRRGGPQRRAGARRDPMGLPRPCRAQPPPVGGQGRHVDALAVLELLDPQPLASGQRQRGPAGGRQDGVQPAVRDGGRGRAPGRADTAPPRIRRPAPVVGDRCGRQGVVAGHPEALAQPRHHGPLAGREAERQSHRRPAYGRAPRA